jgi:hypothetical protein
MTEIIDYIQKNSHLQFNYKIMDNVLICTTKSGYDQLTDEYEPLDFYDAKYLKEELADNFKNINVEVDYDKKYVYLFVKKAPFEDNWLRHQNPTRPEWKLETSKECEGQIRNDDWNKHFNPLIITLDSGREVSVNAFSLKNTYGNMIAGTTKDRYVNKNIFNDAKPPKDWGIRKTRKIKPKEHELQEGLKPYCFSVWLNSNKPIDSEYDGSELVVIWFEDIPLNTTIEQIIHNAVKSIDWESSAQNYHL